MADDEEARAAELRKRVVDVIDDNRYMVLGTVSPDGMPHVSPVYFTHEGNEQFYWVSSPRAEHSRNLAWSPNVDIVIFDSSRPPGPTVGAVYLTGTAGEVADSELDDRCVRAFRDAEAGGGRKFTPAELSGTGSLRLYVATPQRIGIHIRGSDPTFGTGIDTRLTVPPESPPS